MTVLVPFFLSFLFSFSPLSAVIGAEKVGINNPPGLPFRVSPPHFLPVMNVGQQGVSCNGIVRTEGEVQQRQNRKASLLPSYIPPALKMNISPREDADATPSSAIIGPSRKEGRVSPPLPFFLSCSSPHRSLERPDHPKVQSGDDQASLFFFLLSRPHWP